MRRKKNLWKWTLIALVPVFFIVFPIYYIFVGSFETTSQIFHQPPYLFPPTLHVGLENYSMAFKILRNNFLNSMLITIGVIILVLLMAPMAAFALAKLKIKLRGIFSFIFILVQMLPLCAIITPLYLLFHAFKLVDTLLGVIIAISSFAVCFIIIMLIPYMQSFPIALIESASLDGASLSIIYCRIILPLSMPAITTATIFAFLLGWNNFLFPLILIQDGKLYPLSVGLFNFVEQYGVQWGYLMAASAVYSIPAIIITLAGSKYLCSGLMAGAFKE